MTEGTDQLPTGSDPDDLVFSGPVAVGRGVPRGTRTVLSRHHLHRTYHNALAMLADPAVPLRPTTRRILLILREGGPQRIDQLAARLTAAGRRPIRPATVAAARVIDELMGHQASSRGGHLGESIAHSS